MISDWLYRMFGSLRPTQEREDGAQTQMVMEDPYYKFLIVYPFWVAWAFWAPAILFAILWIIGALGWVQLHLIRLLSTASVLGIVGLGFFTISWVVWKYYWVTLPDPDSAARQSFTKKTRYLRNGMVFISLLNMKAWILPGTLRLARSGGKGEPRSIEVWIRQKNGGTDRQFVKLLINYGLHAHEYPRKIQKAFNDQLMNHRLENVEGLTWLSRIQTASEATMKDIDKEIIELLAALADARLASVMIEDLIHDRDRINTELTMEARQKFLDEFGVNVVSVRVDDVQDVVPEGGWIYQESRATQAKKRSRTERISAIAERKAEVTRAAAFQVGQTAVLQAQAEVAKQEVLTTEEKIAAAAKVADLELQPVMASLRLFAADPENINRAFYDALLQKMKALNPTETLAAYTSTTEVFKAAAGNIGNVPQTLVQGVVVNAGDGDSSKAGLGNLLGMHPVTAVAEALGKFLNVPSNPASPSASPSSPSP